MCCLWPRDAKEKSAKPVEAPAPRSSSREVGEQAVRPDAVGFARLTVRVECGSGLRGMDISGIARGGLEKTLDAYVTMAINDEEFFGRTEVKWRCRGSATWQESFRAEVAHPQSYLCVAIWDDDEVFQRDSAITHERLCGFLEVPLWSLPRNSPVDGWFSLHAPELKDESLGIQGRQTKLAMMREELEAKQEEKGEQREQPEPAGRVRLQLLLETTKMKEFKGYLKESPSFETTLPPLDLTQFLEDVQEAKRILLNRLIFALVGSVTYALSWQRPLLSLVVLCWYWFLFFKPRFLWATVWCLVLLCFWHEIPHEAGAADHPRRALSRSPTSKLNLVTGAFRGVSGAVWGVGDAAYTVLARPLEGLSRGGIKGWAVGVKDGIVEGVGKAGAGVVDGVSDVADGVVGTFTGMRAPGINEFQQILTLMPSLKVLVRQYQPTLQNVRGQLESVDALFYWGRDLHGACRATKLAVRSAVVLLVLSLVFSRSLGSISWYLFLGMGSLVILLHAPGVRSSIGAALAAKAVLTRPAALEGCDWFEKFEPAQ